MVLDRDEGGTAQRGQGLSRVYARGRILWAWRRRAERPRTERVHMLASVYGVRPRWIRRQFPHLLVANRPGSPGRSSGTRRLGPAAGTPSPL